MIKQRSNRKHCKRAALLASLIVVSMSIGAAPVVARADVEGIVSGKTANNVEYMSGGVGIDERQQMQMKAKDYDLKLSFADRRGEFISDVKVIIDDRHGKELVNLTTAGPWLFVELPTGNYQLKATFAAPHRGDQEYSRLPRPSGCPIASLGPVTQPNGAELKRRLGGVETATALRVLARPVRNAASSSKLQIRRVVRHAHPVKRNSGRSEDSFLMRFQAEPAVTPK